MKASIVSIGNSRGIRIPKSFIEQCKIEKNVELKLEGKKIIIIPSKGEPRKGWDQAFQQMNENKDDGLLISDNLDLDTEDWEW